MQEFIVVTHNLHIYYYVLVMERVPEISQKMGLKRQVDQGFSSFFYKFFDFSTSVAATSMHFTLKNH